MKIKGIKIFHKGNWNNHLITFVPGSDPDSIVQVVGEERGYITPIATGSASIAFGHNSKSEGDRALVMGNGTRTLKSAINSIAFGSASIAGGHSSIAGGIKSKTTGKYSVAIGDQCTAGTYFEREIFSSIDGGNFTSLDALTTGPWFAKNKDTKEIESISTILKSDYAVIPVVVSGEIENQLFIYDSETASWVSQQNKATGNVALGSGTKAVGKFSMAVNKLSKALGENSFAGGYASEASGKNSFTFGNQNKVSGENSAAFGQANAVTSNYAFTTGWNNEVRSTYGLVAGKDNVLKAGSQYCLVQGLGNKIDSNSYYDLLIGQNNEVSGDGNTHGKTIIGSYNKAIGYDKKHQFLKGTYLTANQNYQTVFGTANAPDSTKMFILANGTTKTEDGNTVVDVGNNIFTIDYKGNVEAKGTIKASAPIVENDVVRKKELDEAIASIIGPDADEALDTIKEIQAILEDDSTGAAGLISTVEELNNIAKDSQEKINKRLNLYDGNYEVTDANGEIHLLGKYSTVGDYGLAQGMCAIAAGGSAEAYGRYSIALGNGCRAGYTEEEFKEKYPYGMKTIDGTPAEEGYTGDVMKWYDYRAWSVALQLSIARARFAFAAGERNESNGDDSFTLGGYNIVDANGAGALGSANKIKERASTSLALGSSNYIGEDCTTAYTLGYSNELLAKNAVSIGSDNRNESENSYSFGRNNKITAADGYIVGRHNTVNGSDGIIFGKENKVLTYAGVAIGRGNTVETSTNLGGVAIGNGNTVTGEEAIAVGVYNEVYGRLSFAAGEKLTNSGAGAAVFGNNNTIGEKAVYSFVAGINNTNNSLHSIVLGEGNKLLNTNGHCSFIVGNNNTSNTGNRIALIGTGLKSNTSGQIVVGEYNIENNNAKFIVGNGTINTPKNAIVVMNNGRVKIYEAPTDPEDAVRLGDISSLMKLVEGLTAEQIIALNNFAKSLTVEEA